MLISLMNKSPVYVRLTNRNIVIKRWASHCEDRIQNGICCCDKGGSNAQSHHKDSKSRGTAVGISHAKRIAWYMSGFVGDKGSKGLGRDGL